MDPTASSSQKRVDALQRRRIELRELEASPVVLEVNRRQLVREIANVNRGLIEQHLPRANR